MSRQAKVESVDALRTFKIALVKFAESAGAALSNAEHDLHRTMSWLENEQKTYWRDQVRKANEEVARAAEALRMKKIFKNFDGTTPSAVDEEKKLALTKRKLEEAERKQESTRRAVPMLQKQILNYKGSVQRLVTSLRAEIPAATGRLEKLAAQIEAYAALTTSGDETFAGAESSSSPPRIEEEPADDSKPADGGGAS